MSVYFAAVNGYMKIGYSKNPWERASTITTGTCVTPDGIEYGDTIDLLGWIPGDRKVEKRIHAQFSALHVLGEWFLDDDAFDAAITDDPFGVPIHDLPAHVVYLMEEYPHVPRAKVVEVYEQQRAEELADPTSVLSQVSRLLGGPDGMAGLRDHGEHLRAERAERRAHWREVRRAERAA